MDASLRIELFPADLDRAIGFYQRLGFTLRGRTARPRYATLLYGGVQLGLAEADPVPPEQRSIPSGAEIVIEVDDVRAVHDQVVTAGVVPTDELQERPWGLTDFRVTDPDGYYLRFTDRRGA